MYWLFLWVTYNERKCLISVKMSEYKDVISLSYLSDLLNSIQRHCWKPCTRWLSPAPGRISREGEERADAEGQAGGASGHQEGAPPLRGLLGGRGGLWRLGRCTVQCPGLEWHQLITNWHPGTPAWSVSDTHTLTPSPTCNNLGEGGASFLLNFGPQLPHPFFESPWKKSLPSLYLGFLI